MKATIPDTGTKKVENIRKEDIPKDQQKDTEEAIKK